MTGILGVCEPRGRPSMQSAAAWCASPLMMLVGGLAGPAAAAAAATGAACRLIFCD